MTVVFGRLFCGAVCPLGSFIDFCDRFLFRKAAKSARPGVGLHALKYALLVAVLLPALFGRIFSLFFDPISILTRIFTILLFPLQKVSSLLALQAGAPALQFVGFESAVFHEITIPVFYASGIAFLLAAAVLAGGILDHRFWCQYICPSGAFFALLSRFTIWRRRVEGCKSCPQCFAKCPARAIDENERSKTDSSECIVCGDCLEIKPACSQFGFGRPMSSAVPKSGRRHFLSGLAGGLFLVPALRTNAVNASDGQGRLVRPPGALPEDSFAAKCLACAECMKVCPTNALQPCSLDQGLARLFTPRVVPRIGACEETCYVCGHVCPTGALRPLTHEQKRFAKIGTAVIDRHRCLAWEQNRECLVCDEACPYNAISMVVAQTATGPFKVPVVDETLCLGCGFCERNCPINDDAAIVVYRFGENRQESGEYVNAWQRQAIEERRKRSEKFAGFGGSDHQATTDSEPKPGNSHELPPGFDVE